jgi:fructosamine-3-kinase
MKNSLESLLNLKVENISRVSGGDIADSFIIRHAKGEFFVKHCIHMDMKCEARALLCLKDTKTVNIPNVVKFNNDFLILDYIKDEVKSEKFFSRLGDDLARLHLIEQKYFGFSENNYIGRTLQINTPSQSWSSFFLKERLHYQKSLLAINGLLDTDLEREIQRVEKLTPIIILGSEEPPSLIHGDLWHGNSINSKDGPYILDPAAYYGHREAELAMTMLFGGYSTVFYEAYNRVYPLKKNWKKRAELYKLYHLLNHMNLFGRSYRDQVICTISTLEQTFS